MFEIQLSKKLHSAQGDMLLDIDLKIPEKQFVSIYGKSGAGKTTLLKMLAGIVQPDKGSIVSGQEIWFNHNTNLSPQKRKIGFVFQDYALFPNMNVRENLEFVLTDKKNKNIVDELLEITSLTGLAQTSVTQLSGGQQQRVALARALVKQPELLLLDEPLSSLDHEMRWKLQDELIKIHKHFQLTTIMISHDTSEIYRLSDTVIKMDFGKIIQQGSPDELFHNNKVSGKVQITGQLISLSKNDVVYIAKILSGNNLMNVIITAEEAEKLSVGDTVLIVSKAFNPTVMKYNS
ncbi:MAG: ATP-binding cassette domain-containing protein [Bacteroidetes bacterium]|nr:ATP-binding cassette domain-containing protein [Bacteroidota bacterium]